LCFDSCVFSKHPCVVYMDFGGICKYYHLLLLSDPIQNPWLVDRQTLL
jgi:hypothetical protein